MLKLISDIEAIKEQARQAAQDTAISAEAAHFKLETDAHRYTGVAWLVAAGAFAGSALLYILGWVKPELSELAHGDLPVRTLVAFAVPRIIVVTLLWFALTFSIRNYTACRHNQIVNRHRQNALNTFQAFVDSPSADVQTMNAVLLQATQCIFAPQTTGYLKGEAEPQQPNQILEIVRGVPGVSKG